jgi:hypothetical protein
MSVGKFYLHGRLCGKAEGMQTSFEIVRCGLEGNVLRIRK